MPVAVRAGISRKISESFRTQVDGFPASHGMPLETEVRYYYNYYFSQDSIDFDTFLSALFQDLVCRFPNLNFTLDWIRKCDAMGRVEVARNAIYKMRSYVRNGAFFKISFWDVLWNLTEVSMKTFGISYDEIGTTGEEIKDLSKGYLLKECKDRVQILKRVEKSSESEAAKKAFLLVDNMLNGTPIPQQEFCMNRQTYYSPGSAYKMYAVVAKENAISPEDVGWSEVEHLQCKAVIFPYGYREESPETVQSDPTAPATAERDEAAIEHIYHPKNLMELKDVAARSHRDVPNTSILNAWTAFLESILPCRPILQGV